jgi:VanZ family protein
MKENRIVKYWFSIVLWMGFIFWMSTGTFSAANTERIIEPLLRFFVPAISGETVEVIHAFVRKCAHVTEYFILGLLVFRAFQEQSSSRQAAITAGISLLIVAGFALTDEFHQMYVSTRTASIIDVCIDAFGGFMAQCVSLLWYHRHRQQRVLGH